VDGEATYDRYEAIFEGIEAPFAFADLGPLFANGDAMLARAGAKPIRLASKSIRCREVIERIDASDDRWQGILCFTLPEALWLGPADALCWVPLAHEGHQRVNKAKRPSKHKKKKRRRRRRKR